jgi:serine/threonine protein kinase
MTTSSAVDLFQNEIQALAQLGHPNVVSFYEVVSHNATPHLVMEFVDGGDLRDLIDYHLDSEYMFTSCCCR